MTTGFIGNISTKVNEGQQIVIFGKTIKAAKQ